MSDLGSESNLTELVRAVPFLFLFLDQFIFWSKQSSQILDEFQPQILGVFRTQVVHGVISHECFLIDAWRFSMQFSSLGISIRKHTRSNTFISNIHFKFSNLI